MAQDRTRGTADPPALPRILTVAGLKKSGKTTVTAALIGELRARGFRVGSVKTFRHHPLNLDRSGADTRRHVEAGAEFTVAILDGELAYFEPRASRAGLRDAARHFPPGIDFVVWEGTADPEAGGGQVVCVRRLSDLEQTLEKRKVDRPSRSSRCRESPREGGTRPPRRWSSAPGCHAARGSRGAHGSRSPMVRAGADVGDRSGSRHRHPGRPHPPRGQPRRPAGPVRTARGGARGPPGVGIGFTVIFLLLAMTGGRVLGDVRDMEADRQAGRREAAAWSSA